MKPESQSFQTDKWTGGEMEADRERYRERQMRTDEDRGQQRCDVTSNPSAVTSRAQCGENAPFLRTAGLNYNI